MIVPRVPGRGKWGALSWDRVSVCDDGNFLEMDGGND
jgi:hypothetical protein